jgi:hypothetical protein
LSFSSLLELKALPVSPNLFIEASAFAKVECTKKALSKISGLISLSTLTVLSKTPPDLPLPAIPSVKIILANLSTKLSL